MHIYDVITNELYCKLASIGEFFQHLCRISLSFTTVNGEPFYFRTTLTRICGEQSSQNAYWPRTSPTQQLQIVNKPSSHAFEYLAVTGKIVGKRARGSRRTLFKTRNINVCQCLQMHSTTNLAVVNISYLKLSSNARGIMDSGRECAAAAIAIVVICKKRKRRIKAM